MRQAHRKQSRITQYLWDGQSIVLEVNAGTDVVKKSYLRGAGLIAQQIDGQLSYYLHNAHGDVVQRTDASGRTLRKYKYDAFGCERAEGVRANNAWAAGGSSRAGNNGGGSASGRIVSQGPQRDGGTGGAGAGSTGGAATIDPDPNPFRYCGEYWDSELQELYLRARTYNPSNGRFSQEDSARDGANWYSYCGGNPIRFSDPSGHKFADATEGGGGRSNSILGSAWGTISSKPSPGPTPAPQPRPPKPVVVTPVSHRAGPAPIAPAPLAVLSPPLSLVAVLAQIGAIAAKLILILALIYAVVDFVSSLFDRPAGGPQTSGPEKAGESGGNQKYGAASIAGTSPATPPPPDEDDNRWGNEDTLQSHFNRHGKDFNAKTPEEYAQMANKFFNNRGSYQVKVDDQGVIRVYDSQTNTFGSYNLDGTTRTFFKPTGGLKYFNGQPGK